MNEILYRMSPRAFAYLTKNYEKHVDLYRDPNADFDSLLRGACRGDYREPIERIRITEPIKMEPPEEGKASSADIQALRFYHSLQGMTPRLATDPSVLAYINHIYLHQYGIKRWKIPLDDDKKAAKSIYNHWITPDSDFSHMYKMNISGRTWWIAHASVMASKASEGGFTAEEALGKFVESAEYYHRSMEWEILCNYDIMAECIRSLLNESSGIQINTYRKMLYSLNLEAGGRVLDALSRDKLRELVARASKTAMESPDPPDEG